MDGDAELFEVVGAGHAGGGGADLLDGGQQQADQHRDDGYDYQQLDQRERPASGEASEDCHEGDAGRKDGTYTPPRRRGIPRPLFGRPTFALAHAFALAHVEAAVRRGGPERLADPVGPEYFDRIDLIDRAQSEMSDRLAAASVALSRVQPRGPEAAPAPDPDLGPVGDALRGGVRRPPRPPHAR